MQPDVAGHTDFLEAQLAAILPLGDVGVLISSKGGHVVWVAGEVDS